MWVHVWSFPFMLCLTVMFPDYRDASGFSGLPFQIALEDKLINLTVSTGVRDPENAGKFFDGWRKSMSDDKKPNFM